MNDEKLKKTFEKKEKLKIRALHKDKNYMWFGLGMIGLVGWSIVIPTFIGIGIGMIIDIKFHSKYSWTLMLLLLGVILGSINVWYWISKERESIEKDNKK